VGSHLWLLASTLAKHEVDSLLFILITDSHDNRIEEVQWQCLTFMLVARAGDHFERVALGQIESDCLEACSPKNMLRRALN